MNLYPFSSVQLCRNWSCRLLDEELGREVLISYPLKENEVSGTVRPSVKLTYGFPIMPVLAAAKACRHRNVTSQAIA